MTEQMLPLEPMTPRDHLYSVVQPYGIDRNDFDELLHLIDPPDELKAYATLFNNLIDILNLIEAIFATDPVQRDPNLMAHLPIWIKCCELLSEHAESIATHISGFNDPPQQVTIPPFGAYKTHPLAVALWCSPYIPEQVSRYRLLQAFVCLCYYIIGQIEEQHHCHYVTIRYNACLALRKLVDRQRDLNSFLELLPEAPVTFREYEKFLDKIDDKDLHPLLVLFTYAIERQEAINRNRSTTIGKQTQTWSLGDPETDGSAEKVSITREYDISSEQANKVKKSLGLPAEYQSLTEMRSSEHPGPDPSGGESNTQQRFKASLSVTAISMSNQRLPYDWELLNSMEIHEFLQEVSKLSEQPTTDSGIPPAELAALLTILFWFSSPLTTALKCQLVPGVARTTDSLSIFWQKDQENGFAVIKPNLPVQNLVPDDVLNGQALSLVSRFTLPIPREAAHALRHHLQGRTESHKAVRLFSKKQKQYETAISEFCKKLRARSGGHQTLNRLARHVHDRLALLPGNDVTMAMALTGRDDFLGNVPLFYTASTVTKLLESYSTVCDEILADAGLPQDKTVRQYETIGGEYVGSRYVPRRESVRRLIAQLKEKLTSAKSMVRKGQPEHERLHNVMTIYTVFLLGFATGYRAVHDPLLHSAEIDWQTGFAVISDKDNAEFHHARIVWLPQICLDQLTRYRTHLSILRDWSFRHNRKLFLASGKNEAVVGRPQNRYGTDLFLLNDESSNLAIHPKLLSELVGRIDYQLPLNGNRHYLRTNLLARKCQTEVINAFMGHAEHGCEPWGKYSGLSPLAYKEELSRCLVPLLNEDGWLPLDGLSSYRDV